MTDEACAEVRLLMQADLDGELGPAEAARVGVHLERCGGCAEAQSQLRALSGRLRAELPYHSASTALHAAVRARLAAVAIQDVSTPELARPRRSWWRRLLRPQFIGGSVPFGAGFVLAACLALLIALPRGSDFPDTVIAGHVRALQPGHLMDIASTDQHTVKPWFDGRLDYAPPVKDLKAAGYPLVGGRLDYLADRAVAVLVYQRRLHVIDLFVWPEDRHFDQAPAAGVRNGYNFVRWNGDGMAFWAVSDLSADELAAFVQLWKAN